MQQRSYYLDWVRVISIGLVFLFHCGRFFDHEDWHVKNGQTSELASQLIFFLSRWIMPLFFFISGASTSFALRGKGFSNFSQGRLKRIGIPLLLAILILSPPQVYLERLSHGQYSGSFAGFLPHYFEGWYAFGGNFAWMGLHLWYLLLLLLFSFVALPLFVLFRKNAFAISATPMMIIFSILLLALPGTFLDPDVIVGSRIWGGWSIVEHFLLFSLGYVLYSSSAFAFLLQKMRVIFLVMAIVFSFVVMVPNPINAIQFSGPAYFLKMLARSAMCLGWVFTILGFASRYLNTPGPKLRQLNEAVLPFYILHQAVIVPVGYFVVNTSWSIGTKYLLIAATSLLIIILLYAVVQRLNGLRFLFGMSVQKPG